MSDFEQDITWLVTGSDVRNTIYRYAVAIDEFDETGVQSVFCDDAVETYLDHPRLEGGDANAAFVNGAADGQIVQRHLINVNHIDVHGLEATAQVYHTSHQWFEGAPFTGTVMFGRHRMELSDWKISTLEMELLWAESKDGRAWPHPSAATSSRNLSRTRVIGCAELRSEGRSSAHLSSGQPHGRQTISSARPPSSSTQPTALRHATTDATASRS